MDSKSEDKPLFGHLGELSADERLIVEDLTRRHLAGEDIAERAREAGIPTFTDYLNSPKFDAFLEKQVACGNPGARVLKGMMDQSKNQQRQQAEE